MNGSLSQVINNNMTLLNDYDGEAKYFATSKIDCCNWTIGIEDYKTMLAVTGKYSDDAKFVNNLVVDFSSTSEELFASNSEVSQAVNGVAQAASEGTSEIIDISNRISKIGNNSNEVLEQVHKAKNSADKLKIEISKFII